MKKIALLFSFFVCFLGHSQFKDAPWYNNEIADKKENVTIEDLKQMFDAYWQTHDKNKKGSGYKPFMRWINHWENNVTPNGGIISPNEMWNAISQKNARKANRNATAVQIPISNWQPIGPFTHTNTGSWSNGQGRVNVVHVDPSNPDIVYIGTPAGGIWKSTTGGTNWVALSDNLPQIGVSGIAVDYNNSDIIYIATGDCDGNDTYSVGVLKSIDGGLTWNTTGLSFNNTSTYAGDILINPNDSNMLWVATSNGIYRTTNAGVNWTNVRTGDFSQGRIRLKPNDPTIVYAVSSNRFYKSTNSGETFVVAANGSGAPLSGRLIMDVTPANPEVIYILRNNTNGIYKSIDGGNTFTQSTNSSNIFESNQGYYDLALCVSPTNENEIYTGCLNIWRSTNGGNTFTKRNSWNSPQSQRYTHADIHYLRYFGNKLYCGSDGGVYVSDNNSTSFTDITASAQISQFYKIAVSNQSASKMVGGLQDNGGHAYSDNQWKNYYGADGMDTAIDPNNSNLYYGFIQNGGSLYISNNAGNSSSGGVGSPNGEDGNWVTPLIVNNAGEVFAGYSNLYRLSGNNWVQQNTIGFGGGNIDLITVDPQDINIMYVCINNTLYKSIDKGITFEFIYDAPNNISSIDVHSSNSNIVYLTTQGTNGQALISNDGGNSFTNFSAGLPNISKRVIVHQGQNANNPLFLGTSLGVYYRDDTLSQWEPFDNNLPNVSVTDLDVNLEDKKLTASTYGRGVWQTDIEVEIPSNDIKLSEILSPNSTDITCTENSITPQVVVKNKGSNVINNVTFNYSINSINLTYDWTGTIASEQLQTITLPTTTLESGAYVLTITSTITNDEVANNNSGVKYFYINQPGVINQVNEFEAQSDNLLAYDDSGLITTWQRGVCTGGVLNTGSNNVYTSNFSGNYDDNRKAFLVSRCYDLTQLVNPKIKFKMAYDLEENWDIVYVEYSVNSGNDWYLLGGLDANWYNSDRTPLTSGDDCNNCPGGQWTGTNATLTDYEYSLFQLGGFSNIMFRIVFHSDSSVTQLGVVVDDFVIEGTTLSNTEFNENSINIYPNPANDFCNISSTFATINKIEVFDVLGKSIYSEDDLDVNTASLNISNFQSGVYLIKIHSDNQNVVKRLIKK